MVRDNISKYLGYYHNYLEINCITIINDFYKKEIVINVLGPVGDKVEEWTLKGAFIQNATFGDLAFDSSDPVEISLTLRYDYAVLKF